MQLAKNTAVPPGPGCRYDGPWATDWNGCCGSLYPKIWRRTVSKRLSSYMGSLEIMNALKAGGQDHDAVWPASSMWISMGDTKQDRKSVV